VLERIEPGHPLGVHRVLDEKRGLPQAAECLDNSLPLYPTEVLIEVQRLNIDAASFVQMENETGHDMQMVGQIVMDNCDTRGKQQNRITGSGGMLMGRVAYVGSKYRGPIKLKKGDKIATLVSLSLTPLHLDEIVNVNPTTHQIEAHGYAILFERTIAAQLPPSLPEPVSLAVYDVAGAPATVAGLCGAGKTLIVIGGGGKAGVLSCVAGRQKVGKTGKVIAIEPFAKAAEDLRGLKVCDEVLEINATDALAVEASVREVTRGKMGDVVINVASVPDTEVSALLCSKSKGKVVFFSMATSFSRVALGAEGIVSDATLIFGNGYYPGHSEMAIDLVRKNKRLRDLFLRRYQ